MPQKTSNKKDLQSQYLPQLPFKTNDIVDVDIASLRGSTSQPRQIFDQSALSSLGESLLSYGQLQPILITPSDENGFRTIIAGERRVRAAELVGLATVRAITTHGDDHTLSLIENCQRADLRPIDLARAVDDLVENRNMSQQYAADIVNVHATDISRLRKVMRLPKHIVDSLESGEVDVSQSVLCLLATVASESSEVVESVWAHVAQGDATVSSVKRTIQAARNKQSADENRTSSTSRDSKNPGPTDQDQIKICIDKSSQHIKYLEHADRVLLKEQINQLTRLHERVGSLLQLAHAADGDGMSAESDPG